MTSATVPSFDGNNVHPSPRLNTALHEDAWESLHEDAAIRAKLRKHPGFNAVELPFIDRTAPICTTCGEVINNPERNGAITMTASSHGWPEELPFCVLENARYH